MEGVVLMEERIRVPAICTLVGKDVSRYSTGENAVWAHLHLRLDGGNTMPEFIPGQFAMIWYKSGISTPGSPPDDSSNNIPFSITYRSDDGTGFGVAIKDLGPTSRAMVRMPVGSRVGVMGPFGKGFQIKGSAPLLVCGGVGSAPLLPVARAFMARNSKVVVIMGGKALGEHVLLEAFEALQDTSELLRLHVCSDDGCLGDMGFVTHFMDRYETDGIYSCGPEPMLAGILDHALEKDIPAQFSMERYMKCGMGLCGSCVIDGTVTCREGPVFDRPTVEGMKEFASISRGPDGIPKGRDCIPGGEAE